MGYKKGTFNHSEGTKKRISETMKKGLKEKKFTNAFCKGNIPWNKGKKMSDETKRKLSNSIKEVWKDKDKRDVYVKAQTGKKNTPESNLKRRKKVKEWHKENKDSEEYIKRSKKIAIGLKKYFEENPEVRKANSIRMKENMKDESFREKAFYSIRNIKPNKPEKKLLNLIEKKKLSFEYVGNGAFWIRLDKRNFNPDFIDKKNKLIIEVFGVYWHNRTEALENDKIRLKAYEIRGYKCLIIWDEELKDIEKVNNKIESFCKNVKN